MTGDDTDPQILALARGVERATRRVGNVEQLVRQLATDTTRRGTDLELLVQQLAADVTALTRVVGDPDEPDPDAATGAVRSWLLCEDATQARTDLADLVKWLAAVHLRYPGAVANCSATSRLPRCR